MCAVRWDGWLQVLNGWILCAVRCSTQQGTTFPQKLPWKAESSSLERVSSCAIAHFSGNLSALLFWNFWVPDWSPLHSYCFPESPYFMQVSSVLSSFFSESLAFNSRQIVYRWVALETILTKSFSLILPVPDETLSNLLSCTLLQKYRFDYN